MLIFLHTFLRTVENILQSFFSGKIYRGHEMKTKTVSGP